MAKVSEWVKMRKEKKAKKTSQVFMLDSPLHPIIIIGKIPLHSWITPYQNGPYQTIHHHFGLCRLAGYQKALLLLVWIALSHPDNCSSYFSHSFITSHESKAKRELLTFSRAFAFFSLVNFIFLWFPFKHTDIYHESLDTRVVRQFCRVWGIFPSFCFATAILWVCFLCLHYTQG